MFGSMWKTITFWIGIVLWIGCDAAFHIPLRVHMLALAICILVGFREHNKQLNVQRQESRTRFDALEKQFELLNDRLRWVELWLFGCDGDDILSEEWSARRDEFRKQTRVNATFRGVVNEVFE